jgi:hypothetical protein
MKRGRTITIKINLSNRWLYTFIIMGILAIIGVGVLALTPGIAPNPGHLISEMAPPSPCTTNQYLQFDGTNWKCALPTLSYSPSEQLITSAATLRQTTSTTYTKIKEIQVGSSGIFRIKFGLLGCGSSSTSYGKIYINGITVGTERTKTGSGSAVYFSEDIPANKNDLIQLYLHASSGCTAGASAFEVDGSLTGPFVVNLD